MAALSIAIEQARRQTATRANREQMARIERRLDEKAKVYGIADEYDKADRRGDLRVETAFARLMHAATTERMRELITATYMAWMQDERDEHRAVHSGVGSAIGQMEQNDETFVGESLS